MPFEGDAVGGMAVSANGCVFHLLADPFTSEKVAVTSQQTIDRTGPWATGFFPHFISPT